VGELKGSQKKYLKGLAHGMKPLVFVGQKGLSSTLIKAVDEALEVHELIKVKFLEHKEKDLKKTMAEAIEKETASELIGMIGHMAIYFRRQADPDRRKIDITKVPLG
jgi:RNA-binding protein